MATKNSRMAAAAAVASITAAVPEVGPEGLASETTEGLPIEVERLDVVNRGSATDIQRAELQACLTRLNSINFAATKDVFAIRALLFGDGRKTT